MFHVHISSGTVLLCRILNKQPGSFGPVSTDWSDGEGRGALLGVKAEAGH